MTPIDYLMFTGSTGIGRTVASQAAEGLIPASMELGGKNAMLVLEDADLDRAVEGAERALFSNASQLCTSIERVLVHESVADEFTRRLADRTRDERAALWWFRTLGARVALCHARSIARGDDRHVRARSRSRSL
jgi:succinate-semialdehyde dehydrogenase/glutarate-semialdehyde dehydrogenase